MSTRFLDLLKQIKDEIIIYEPFHRTTQGIAEFQDTVHRLQEMKQLGLIRRLFTQTRTNHEGEFINLAMVQGGLTEEGEQLLAEHLTQSA